MGQVVATSKAEIKLSAKDLKKEARLERKWEKLLAHSNKSQDFVSDSIRKISSNWAEVVKDNPSVHSSTFLDLPTLVEQLIDRCAKKKWYKGWSESEQSKFRHDCEVYIAGEIWDYKQKTDNFCDLNYARRAYTRTGIRESRKYCNESFSHGIKPVVETADEVKALAVSLNKRAESEPLEDIKSAVKELTDRVEALDLSLRAAIGEMSKALDQKFMLLNPPDGLKGLRSGKLYQFPEAK